MKRTIVTLLILLVCRTAVAQETTASWYSRASCAREGTGGADIRMANGRRLVDEDLTCAAWNYRFGTVLKVTNLRTKKSVTVTVTDRGPAKRLVRIGRICDLSRGAFERLAPLSEGIIPVKIERIK